MVGKRISYRARLLLAAKQCTAEAEVLDDMAAKESIPTLGVQWRAMAQQARETAAELQSLALAPAESTEFDLLQAMQAARTAARGGGA